MKKDQIQYRLEIINSAKKIGISKSANLYEVDRSTIRRWIRKFNEMGESGLKNRSKKGLVEYSNQLSEDCIKRIITLKKKDPKISINRIKVKLNLDCHRSTIFKKLKEHGLSGSGKKNLSGDTLLNDQIPFTNFYLHVINLGSSYGYLYLMTEELTKIQFVAFSCDFDQINTLIFAHFFLQNLERIDISPQNITIKMENLNKNYQLPITKLKERFNAKFEFSKRIPDQFKSSLVDSKFFSMFGHFEKKNLIDRYYANLMLNNSLIFKNLRTKVIQGIESIVGYRKVLNNLLYKVYPLDLDPHFDVSKIFSIDNYWEQCKDHDISNRTNTLLINIASTIANKFEHKKAISLFDTLIVSTEFTDDTTLRLYSMLYKSSVFQRMRRLKESQNISIEGVKLSKKYKLKYLQTKFLSQLGGQHFFKGEFRESIKYYEQSLKRCRENSYRNDEINILINLSAIYQKLGNDNKAIRRYNKLLPILDDSDKRKVLVYSNIAAIYQHKKQFDRSMELYKNGAKIGREIKAYREVSQILNNMGDIYLKTYNDSESIKCFEEMLHLVEIQKSKGLIAVAYNNIGSFYHAIGDFKRGLSNYKAALKVSSEINDNNYMGFCILNISEIYFELKSYRSALDEIDTAIEIFENSDDRSNLPLSYLLKGKILLAMKNYFSADKVFTKAIDIAKKLNRGDNLKPLTIYKEVNRLLRINSGYTRYTTTKEELVISIYENYESLGEVKYSNDRYGALGEIIYSLFNSDTIKDIKLKYIISIETMTLTIKDEINKIYNLLYKRSKRDKYLKRIENLKKQLD